MCLYKIIYILSRTCRYPNVQISMENCLFPDKFPFLSDLLSQKFSSKNNREACFRMSVKYYSKNSRPKRNYKIVYCSLKNMSLRGIGARGDTQYQNFNSFFGVVNILKRNIFGKPIWFDVQAYFSELKAFFANLFSKDTSVSILSIHLHNLGTCIGQIKHQI